MRKRRQGNMIRLPILIAPRHRAFVKKMIPNRPVFGKPPVSIRRARNGATLIEYALCGFILVIILSLLSMGLLRARESAREQLCLRRLAVLAKAVDNYGETHDHYPGYANSDANAQMVDRSWVAAALPHLIDRLPAIDRAAEGWKFRSETSIEGAQAPKKPWPEWKMALHEPISHLICPSDDPAKVSPGGCSFVASCGYPDAPDAKQPDFAANGIFLDLRKLPPLSEAKLQSFDGTEHTVLLSENMQSGTWDSQKEEEIGFVWTEQLAGIAPVTGSRIPEVFGINVHSRGVGQGFKTARPSSRHQGGVHVVFANTRLSRIGSDIDPVVYIRLCTVNDGALMNPWTGKQFGPPLGRENPDGKTGSVPMNLKK